MPDQLARVALLGPNGEPLPRVRDRTAPAPRRQVGLEGWVQWRLIDKAGRIASGGEQHNLILNTMLDFIATNSITGGFFTGNALASALTHFAVGTGSTPPDVTDVALDSELARTTIQTINTVARPSSGVYEIELEREFGFAVGNGNLTEFGFAFGVSGDMLVRELFRDGGGNPITITKTSAYKLRIKYTLTVAFEPVTPAASSFNLAGIGLITGTTFVIGGSSAPATGSDITAIDLVVFSRMARGQITTGNVNNTATPRAHNAASAVNNGYASDVSLSNDVGDGSVTPNAYTPGDYARSFNATFGTNAANIEWQLFGICRNASAGATVGRPGWVFLIDPADYFTKDNLHILTLNDFVTYSWDRA